ncbi:MAG: B12-binding domain-containing radical SAM protein [Nitrospirae bacterium]|nr:B12-binding domain-containing radical SAM protein [Nitrospirota bacterium]
MKITLIELSVPDTSAIGVRSLSSYLKKHGYEVRIIFLANGGHKIASGGIRHSDEVVDQVVALCKDADLIGLSFLSSGFHRAAQITKSIKRLLKVPVIWGGIHATIEVAQCLEYADGVCRGEGEEALLELAECLKSGRNYYETENFCFMKDGRIIQNQVRPLIQDLDSLPFIDYAPGAEHYALIQKRNEIRKMDWELQKDFLTPRLGRADIGPQTVYTTMTARGCPHTCSYCFHSLYRPMYKGQRYIRKRSPENVMAELSAFRAHYDFRGAIWFADDDFFARLDKDVESFSTLYKQEVGLNFFCLGSPTTVTEQKLTFLTAAGLSYFEFGIQTGSARTKAMFHRSFSNDLIIKQTGLINRFKKEIPLPYYDFILDNPWETEEDEIETLDLIMRIPKPFHLALASFRYFPGSVLYDNARKEGLVDTSSQQSYSGEFWRLKGKYSNFLIFLYANYGVPGPLIRLMAGKKLFGLLNRKALSSFYTAFFKIYEVGQMARVIIARLLRRR